MKPFGTKQIKRASKFQAHIDLINGGKAPFLFKGFGN